ncbi:unnamed protein product [Darwinula stevensoni]|uniref:ENTH domain-containing protein n=1 Tax=Darwinula stevensoni TaxID=69355 RepID=A0A7R8X3E7_9CRUS|nr:unnamed protein product [Darwinula stevensoni]CAG0878582.1 unnamed protein product [Darwinula stevensoni]
MSGQTITDRLTAARYSLAGQGLAKSVCKATTEEVIGPKKKHLDYLLACTNEPNVSIPQLANLLIERTQNSNWVVVFKALISVHHLMCYGNERFTQYLASSNCSFQLGNFLDKSGVAGYDMSTFIRRYAKYLNEKALSYRTVAFDFCKVKRGKEDGTLRTMPSEKLLKTLPILQSQLDALLEFDCTANELTNGVINTAFMLLFRDLIRLFACYNDGIINLLGSAVGHSVRAKRGIDVSDGIGCLLLDSEVIKKKQANLLLRDLFLISEKYFDMNKKQCRDALELYKRFLIRMDKVAEFLKVAEKVGMDQSDIPNLAQAPSSLLDALEQHLAALEGRKHTPSSSIQPRASVQNAVSILSSTSSALSAAAANGHIDETLKRQALADEEAAFEQLKQSAKQTNPFLESPTAATVPLEIGKTTAASDNIIDLLASPTSSIPPHANIITSLPQGKASDDLLQLSGNPFADILASASSPAPLGMPGPNIAAPTPITMMMPQSMPGLAPASVSLTNNIWNTPNGFDAFGNMLKPTPAAGQPSGVPMPSKPQPQKSANLKGDLDTALASLAENLTIQSQAQNKSVNWNSPKNTGGKSPSTGMWNQQPQVTPAMAAPFRPMGSGGMMGGGQIGMGTGITPPMMPMMGGNPAPAMLPSNQNATQLDPFGAL